MDIIKEINEFKVPIIPIDEDLARYDNVVLFPKKVARANEVLKKIGLPKFKVKAN
jgi:hypothetical protein